MPAKKIEVHIDGKPSFFARPRPKGSAARVRKADMPEELAERALAVMAGRVARNRRGQFTKRMLR